MLPTPGNVTAMPVQNNPAEAALPGTVMQQEIAPQETVPALPGAAPAAVSSAYHQPTELDPPPLGEAADVTVVETVATVIPPAPVGSVVPPLPGAALAPALAPAPDSILEAVVSMPPPAVTTVVPATASAPLAAATPPPVVDPAPVATQPAGTSAPPPIPPQAEPAPVTVVEPVATFTPAMAPAPVAQLPATAVAQTAQVPATLPPPQANPLAGIQQSGQIAESDGFEDMEIGFGSFPIVTLKETTFNTSDGDNLGTTFACVMHHRRKKMLFKCRDDNDAEEMVYSYDGVNTSGGKPLAGIFAEWAAKGWTEPFPKEYSEVTAQLVDLTKGELGNVVLLSIPKSSNARLIGYRTTVRLKGMQLNEVITQIYPGQRVTSGAKKPFYPWAFKEHNKVINIIR